MTAGSGQGLGAQAQLPVSPAPAEPGAAGARLSPRHGLAGACIVAPWLVPLAPGPAANVLPWLAGAAFTVFLFLLSGPVRPPRGLLAAAVVGLLLVVLHPQGLVLDRAAFAAGAVLVLLAAAAGRGLAVAGRGRGADLLAAAWLAAALASAAIALLQYFGLGPALQPWVYPGAAGEAPGNLRQPNLLASLLAIGLAAALLLAARGARLAWLLPAVALLGVATAATASRTGLLHWLVLSALALAWPGARRVRLLLCAAGLAACALALLVLPLLLQAWGTAAAGGLLERMGSGPACSSRRVLWANVLQLVAQRPLLGWGWGELDYAHYLHLYPGERFCDILDNAHNLPLHVAVELGLPAALLLCGVLALAVWRGRPWAEGDAGRQLAWSVLAVLAVHSLLEYPLWYAPFQVALGLAIGLLAAPSAVASTVLRPRGRAAVAAAALALVAYAGWDYLRVSQIYQEPEQRLAHWRDDTLAQARRSWLFAGQAGFAELTLAALTPANAAWMRARAEALLHYSPEPRVIERLVESTTMLERYDEAVLHLARYRAAFPQQYARWREAQKRPLPLPPP